jgi:hypothetical protein
MIDVTHLSIVKSGIKHQRPKHVFNLYRLHGIFDFILMKCYDKVRPTYLYQQKCILECIDLRCHDN